MTTIDEGRPPVGGRVPDFTMSTIFRAPREAVYDAWTNPVQLEQWFGPPGVPIIVDIAEIRPGGKLAYRMIPPGGEPMYGTWVFQDLVRPERFSYVVSFTDENWTPIRHPMSATWPLQVHAEARLTEVDGSTLQSTASHPINATAEEEATFMAAYAGMEGALNDTFSRLAAFLERQGK